MPAVYLSCYCSYRKGQWLYHFRLSFNLSLGFRLPIQLKLETKKRKYFIYLFIVLLSLVYAIPPFYSKIVPNVCVCMKPSKEPIRGITLAIRIS